MTKKKKRIEKLDLKELSSACLDLMNIIEEEPKPINAEWADILLEKIKKVNQLTS